MDATGTLIRQSSRLLRAASSTASRQSEELRYPSIYHEPWWLDIAADGQWSEARVIENGVTVGRMAYPIESRRGFRISTVPSLIRTLGPVVLDFPGKPVAKLRRRLEIVNQLIDQLPAFDSFDQLFDPAVPEAVTFIYRGFVIGATYAFQIVPGLSEAEIWSGMNDKTRNLVRKTGKSLSVLPIDDPDAFASFYDGNLSGEANRHGTSRMATLLGAMLSRGAGTLLGAYDQPGRLAAAAAIPWDDYAAHYFLATRRNDAGAGATSLLIWEAARLACSRGIAFDLDGITSPANLQFLSGFGGSIVQRLRVRRETRRIRLARHLGLVPRLS